ncbi:MAG: methionine--tRNA ligase [bacterium]|nr:methionine--tRNA ligase [bacterium]
MTIDEFQKCDLRIGRVLGAERVASSDKLIKLEVDLEEKNEEGLPAPRQIIAGIGRTYAPEDLVGKQIVIVANLESRKFTIRSDSGQVVLESQGMLLASHNEDDSPVILTVEREVPPGSTIS